MLDSCWVPTSIVQLRIEDRNKMRYRIVMDANAMLFLICAGHDYHESVCPICSEDNPEGPDMCPVSFVLLDYFFDALRIYDERSRSIANVSRRV